MEIKYRIIAEVDGEQVAKLETSSVETAYDLVRIAEKQVNDAIEELYSESTDLETKFKWVMNGRQ